MKKKLFFAFVCLAVLFALAVTAFAAAETTDPAEEPAEPVTVTADFAADPAAALALLRAAKTEGADDPSWNAWAKTLTLRGVDFTTTARCAVILPADSTLELADGTENFLASGDFVTEEAGEADYEYTYVYGIYTAGDLTVCGGGSLTVRAGNFQNTGKTPESVGLYVGGDLTMRGGNLTAMGGEARFVKANTDGFAFSVGVEVAGGDVRLTGGCLHGIAAKAVAVDAYGDMSSFSRGVCTLNTDVTVSGDGRLHGEVAAAARVNSTQTGIYISGGKLSVYNTAEVVGEGTTGIDVTGEILLDGGALRGVGGGEYGGYGIDLEGTGVGSAKKWSGNLTVSGGTLTAVGGVSMYAPNGTNKAVFRMTDGAGTVKMLSGAQQLLFEGGSLTVGSDAVPGSVSATAVALSGGSMDIVAEAGTTSGSFPRGFALSCTTLTVSGGTLSARYGTAAPQALPDIFALVQATQTADFTGGTTILDAGSGNVAVLATAYRYSPDGGSYTDGVIRMSGSGMQLSGSTAELPEDGAASLTQAAAGVPVAMMYPRDMSGDGAVTIVDVLLALRGLLDGRHLPASLDVNGDGAMMLADILLLLRDLPAQMQKQKKALPRAPFLREFTGRRNTPRNSAGSSRRGQTGARSSAYSGSSSACRR